MYGRNVHLRVWQRHAKNKKKQKYVKRAIAKSTPRARGLSLGGRRKGPREGRLVVRPGVNRGRGIRMKKGDVKGGGESDVCRGGN